MCKLFILALLVIIGESVFARTFDQRQNGDLNVQVDVKNINVFALTKGKEEYVDYDYAYDYSEMTIKPQIGTTTTKKPLNTSVTVMPINKDNTTVLELESTTQITEKITVFPQVVIEDPPALDLPSNTTLLSESPNKNNTVIECKRGFIGNKGNCELKLQNPSNTLLKMLQKSKPNGGNGVRKP